MGGYHVLDLTSQVTHLIVGDYDTPKYRFVAKERPDIKVVTPEFVEAARLLWIEDRPVNLSVLEKAHLRPTLQGLRICVTGFEDRKYNYLAQALGNSNNL
jgi:DNA replication regulator DPB11